MTCNSMFGGYGSDGNKELSQGEKKKSAVRKADVISVIENSEHDSCDSNWIKMANGGELRAEKTRVVLLVCICCLKCKD